MVISLGPWPPSWHLHCPSWGQGGAGPACALAPHLTTGRRSTLAGYCEVFVFIQGGDEVLAAAFINHRGAPAVPRASASAPTAGLTNCLWIARKETHTTSTRISRERTWLRGACVACKQLAPLFHRERLCKCGLWLKQTPPPCISHCERLSYTQRMPQWSCISIPVHREIKATFLKFLHCYYTSSEKPPHQSVKSFSPYLKGRGNGNTATLKM